MQLIKRHLFVFVVFIVGLLATGVVAFIYAHGGDTSLIHGCVRPSTGLLRIVGANEDCSPNETSLDWNITGPPGPAGPAGPPGPGAGGVTGRWEGTMIVPQHQCDPGGTYSLIAIFVQDSLGNITGSLRSTQGQLPATFGSTLSVLGKVTQPQIDFVVADVAFTGAVQDTNNMSGTFGCASGTWSAQRVPLLP